MHTNSLKEQSCGGDEYLLSFILDDVAINSSEGIPQGSTEAYLTFNMMYVRGRVKAGINIVTNHSDGAHKMHALMLVHTAFYPGITFSP